MTNPKTPLVLAALALLLGVLAYFRYRATRRPVVSTAASVVPSSPPVPPRMDSNPVPGLGQLLKTPRVGNLTKEKMQRRLDNYLEETRYPPASRPLSMFLTYRYPDAPPPLSRSVSGGKPRVEQRERQSMRYVAEGETPTVFVDFTLDGEVATNVEHVNGMLAKVEGTPPVLGGGISNVVFRDDGAAPDEKAHDGTVTASVPFPKEAIGNFLGNLQLTGTMKSGEKLLFVTFGFVYTGHPPARFTGQVRETIENGSLVLYAGVEIEEQLDYVMRARLYDADDNPLVFMTADGGYGPSTHEIRFVAFGRALRDLQAKSPFRLRDVEGFADMPDAHPERKKVPTWPGPYMTRHYGPNDFSDKEWMTPEKEALIDQMQKAIAAAPEE